MQAVIAKLGLFVTTDILHGENKLSLSDLRSSVKVEVDVLGSRP